jgi:1,2-diacylglycerol 3-alpha-glucosyltransferase
MKNVSDAKTKQNILMVSDDFLPAATGVGFHMQIICRELVSHGHQVVILTSRQKGQPSEETWHGVKVYRAFSVNVAGFYQGLPTPMLIKKILRTHDINVVHFHYLSFMMLMVSVLVKNLKIKKVFTYHMSELVLTQPWFMRPFRRLIGRQITQFANSVDEVISPSQTLKESLTKKGITNTIHHLTNPLAHEFFHKKSMPSIRQSSFQILYAGRLSTEKNIALLIKAFALHLKTSPQSILWLAGKGDQEVTLKKLSGELGISNQVHFLGFKSHAELAQYYQSCDTFVLPSIEEVLSLVVIEAMSYAKPVIMTHEVASSGEMITQDSNGFLVDPHDPSDLATQLNLLADSEETRQRLGKESKIRSAQYNPEVVTAKLLQIYGVETERSEKDLQSHSAESEVQHSTRV